jgi:hypothetical protein
MGLLDHVDPALKPFIGELVWLPFVGFVLQFILSGKACLFYLFVLVNRIYLVVCFATTGLCLYYILRCSNRKSLTISGYITTGSLLLLLAYSILAFVVNIVEGIETTHNVLALLHDRHHFSHLPAGEVNYLNMRAGYVFELAIVPVFLGIYDAFLVSTEITGRLVNNPYLWGFSVVAYIRNMVGASTDVNPTRGGLYLVSR